MNEQQGQRVVVIGLKVWESEVVVLTHALLVDVYEATDDVSDLVALTEIFDRVQVQLT